MTVETVCREIGRLRRKRIICGTIRSHVVVDDVAAFASLPEGEKPGRMSRGRLGRFRRKAQVLSLRERTTGEADAAQQRQAFASAPTKVAAEKSSRARSGDDDVAQGR